MPHPTPSGSVLVGLGVFLLTSLLCTSACFFVANEYVHHATVVRVEKDPNYQELRAFDDEEEEGGKEQGAELEEGLIGAAVLSTVWMCEEERSRVTHGTLSRE